MRVHPLTDERLAALARNTRVQAKSFTDPLTGTAEIRVLELLALVEELLVRRGEAADLLTRPVR